MSQSSIKAFLSTIPLFQDVKPEPLDNIAQACREQSAPRGSILFNKGDPCEGVYYVIKGQIKLAFLTREGDEKVLELISPDQSFGEAVMFANRPTPVYAQATQDSELIFVPKNVIFAEVEQDSKFAFAMLSGLSTRLHQIVTDVEEITLYTSAQRVIGYLLRNDLSHSAPHDGVYTLELPASKGLIASRLNLRPETFSRILHNLCDQGLLKIDGRRIGIPDVDALTHFGYES